MTQSTIRFTITAVDQSGGALNSARAAAESLATAAERAGAQARRAGEGAAAAGEGAARGMDRAARSAEGMGTAAERASQRTRTAGTAAEQSMGRAGRAADEAARSTDRLGIAFSGLTTILAAGGVVSMGRSFLQAGVEIDGLQRRFASLTGSAQRGAEAMQFISRTAQNIGGDFRALAQGYTGLLNLSNSGVLDERQARALTEGFAIRGNLLGTSSEELKRSLYGLSQALSQGTVRAEEFNQVTEALPGLAQEIERALGLQSGALRRMVVEGQMSSRVFLGGLLQALEAYRGRAEEAASTAQAAINRFNNSWLELSGTLAQNVLPIMTTILDRATAITRTGIRYNANIQARMDAGEDVGWIERNLGALAATGGQMRQVVARAVMPDTALRNSTAEDRLAFDQISTDAELNREIRRREREISDLRERAETYRRRAAEATNGPARAMATTEAAEVEAEMNRLLELQTLRVREINDELTRRHRIVDTTARTAQNAADRPYIGDGERDMRFGTDDQRTVSSAVIERIRGQITAETDKIREALTKAENDARTAAERIQANYDESVRRIQARVAEAGASASSLQSEIDAGMAAAAQVRDTALRDLQTTALRGINERLAGLGLEMDATGQLTERTVQLAGAHDTVADAMRREAMVADLVNQAKEAGITIDADLTRAALANAEQRIAALGREAQATQALAQSRASAEDSQRLLDAARQGPEAFGQASRELNARRAAQRFAEQNRLDPSDPRVGEFEQNEARRLANEAAAQEALAAARRNARGGASAARREERERQREEREAQRLEERRAETVERFMSSRQADIDLSRRQLELLRQMNPNMEAMLESERALAEVERIRADLARDGIQLSEQELGQMREKAQEQARLNAQIRDQEEANQIRRSLDPGLGYAEEIAKIQRFQEQGMLSAQEASRAMGQAQERLIDSLASQGRAVKIEWESVVDALADVLAGTEKLEDALKRIALDLSRQVLRASLNSLLGDTGGGLNFSLNRALGFIPQSALNAGSGGGQGGAAGGGGGGGLGGIFNSLLGGIGSLFGGFRDAGGPVMGGVPVVVGERRPELFVPSAPGRIYPYVPPAPAGAGGGAAAAPQVINISISTPNPEAFRQSLGQVRAGIADAASAGRRYR